MQFVKKKKTPTENSSVIIIDFISKIYLMRVLHFTMNILSTLYEISFPIPADRSTYPELQNGGAIQIKLCDFQVDYYPYHLAIKDRSHWGLYSESRYPHPQWLMQSQTEFKNLLLNLVEDNYTVYRSTSSYDESVDSSNSSKVKFIYLFRDNVFFHQLQNRADEYNCDIFKFNKNSYL